MTTSEKRQLCSSITKEQTCKMFHCTMEQLNAHYLINAKQMEKLYQKAVALGKKVNGFTADQLKVISDNYYQLAQC